MKKIFFIIVLFTCSALYSQISLGENYDNMVNEIIRTNEVVLEASYLGKPLVLHFTKEVNMTEYYKSYTFFNKICVLENHLYPLSLFDIQFALFKRQYGTPQESYIAGIKIYTWQASGGLIIAMGQRASRFSGKVVTAITYSKAKDSEKIDENLRMQNSGLTEFKALKPIE